MRRLKYLAIPALAALVLPVTADAGILRGRFGGSSVVVNGPATPAAPTAQTPVPAPAPAPRAVALPAAPAAAGPAGVAAGPAGVAAGPASGGCGPGGCGVGGHGGGGGFGGFLERLCGHGGGGYGDPNGHGGHGGALGNHPPSYDGHGFRGFGFCQPPFQAAPWYLYWPYDAHFQLPAPINAPYYPPQQLGSQWSPYFAAPAPAFGAPPPGMPGMPGMPGAPAYGPIPR
jgi:hypothetical protein